MEDKHVSSILLLSLFTVAVHNDVKAAKKKYPCGKNSEILDASDEFCNPITSLGNVNLCQLALAEFKSALAECQKHSVDLESQLQQFGLKKRKTALVNQRNQCIPYACGTAIAETIDYLFFCFDGTGILEKSNLLQLFRQSVKNSKQLQILYLTTACYGGQPHKFLNRDSAGTDSLRNGCKIGLANIAGETVNAVALQLGWNKFTARHRKKIARSPIAKLVCKLPKPIIKICQDLGFLFTVYIFWNIQKTTLQKLYPAS